MIIIKVEPINGKESNSIKRFFKNTDMFYEEVRNEFGFLYIKEENIK